MAEKESGWTDERPDENGIYWHRQEGILPEVLLVHGGFVYDFGDKEPTSIGFFDGGKWLGPLYASDAQQLIELRKLAQISLDLLSDVYNSRASQRFSAIGLSRIQSHIQDLRERLNPKPEKETPGK